MVSVAFSRLYMSPLERRGHYHHIASSHLFVTSCKGMCCSVLGAVLRQRQTRSLIMNVTHVQLSSATGRRAAEFSDTVSEVYDAGNGPTHTQPQKFYYQLAKYN